MEVVKENYIHAHYTFFRGFVSTHPSLGGVVGWIVFPQTLYFEVLILSSSKFDLIGGNRDFTEVIKLKGNR